MGGGPLRFPMIFETKLFQLVPFKIRHPKQKEPNHLPTIGFSLSKLAVCFMGIRSSSGKSVSTFLVNHVNESLTFKKGSSVDSLWTIYWVVPPPRMPVAN